MVEDEEVEDEESLEKTIPFFNRPCASA